MSHVELHLAFSRRESYLLGQAGLPYVHIAPEACSSCDRPIGDTGDGPFVPVAVALSDQDLAYLCETCIQPLIKTLNLTPALR